MPSIDIGLTGPQGLRAIGAVDARTSNTAAIPATTRQSAGAAAPTVQPSAARDAGTAPVDGERVAEIRKAIEAGNYPVIPMRVSDAMIAAGFLLRSQK